MRAHRLKTALIILMLSMLVAGCGSSFSGGLPGPLRPVNPGDENLPGGEEPISRLEGTVVFGDTGLGLTSTVTFTTQTVPANSGQFSLHLPQGMNAYVIRTLLGDYRGSVNHDGAGQKQLTVPPFDGWSKDYFNQLLIVDGFNTTRRWRLNSEIPVWIEKPWEDASVTSTGLATARAVLAEWQDVLRGAVRFHETTNKSVAQKSGITISSWRIAAGALYIRYDWQDSSALLLHELGHCLGLRHSDKDDDVMYDTIDLREKPLTEREKNIARLLYSIPGGTRAFSSVTSQGAPSVLKDVGRVRIPATQGVQTNELHSYPRRQLFTPCKVSARCDWYRALWKRGAACPRSLKGTG